MMTQCFLTWTSGRLSKEIQKEEQDLQSGQEGNNGTFEVVYLMAFGYSVGN